MPWQLGETLIIGIGQGYMQATPLQLAVMTARIANGGRAVLPSPGARRAAAPSAQPAAARRRRSASRTGRCASSGRACSRSSTASAAPPARPARPSPSVALAGKTGTSQVRRISHAERATGVRKNEDKPWEERDHALFVAFAPYREPRYALAVVVEHGGSGSQAAAPIARDIMAKALELDPTRPRPPLTAGARAGAPAQATRRDRTGRAPASRPPSCRCSRSSGS